MKQEDKELLMKDLCMRLPYGVKVKTKDDDDAYMLLSLHPNKNIALIGLLFVDTYATSKVQIDEIKPYLRPMTSMTEDERKEWKSLIFDENFARLFYKNDNSIELWVNRHSDYDLEIDFNLVLEAISWLLSHHFDFRGLLDKGLAIEVNESNNPYND